MGDPEDSYEDYLERLADVHGRKRLDPETFDALSEEYGRLVSRIDPDDIQLDEWKRFEELRFLLIVEEEEFDET